MKIAIWFWRESGDDLALCSLNMGIVDVLRVKSLLHLSGNQFLDVVGLQELLCILGVELVLLLFLSFGLFLWLLDLIGFVDFVLLNKTLCL